MQNVTTIENDVLLRIKKIIHHYKLKQFSFAERIGMDPGNFSAILSGKRQVTMTTIYKIIDAFPVVNVEWLTNGDGEMLNNPENTPSATLPLLPFEVIGGFPVGDNDGAMIEQCERYSVPDFAQRGAQFLVRVSGSSMYPKYSNGDILAVRRLEDVTFFQWGKVYVLDTSQGAIIKRVFPGDGDNITCHSDNSDNYPDFEVNKEDIRGVGIVVGCIRLE